MTDDKKNGTEFKEFMEHYGVPVNIAKLSKQRKEDPRDDKKDDAFKALRKIAYEYAKENGEAENVEENDYNDQETIEQNIGFVSGNNRSIAAHKFGKKSIDSLIAQIPNETLENLVANEDPENPLLLRKLKDKKDIEVYRNFQAINGLQNLMERYDKDQPLGEKETEGVLGTAARGYASKMAEEAAKPDKDGRKMSNDLIELRRSIAYRAFLAGFVKKNKIKEYALEGLKLSIKDAKAKYEKSTKDNDRDIYKVVGKLVKDLSSGESDEANALMAGVYSAQKQYEKANENKDKK